MNSIGCFALFLWQLIKELEAPVEYIVLPTFAYEHKIFVGPFSRKFPKAQVWVAPRQWSWPLNLPLEFFGIFRAKIIKDGDLSTPWAEEIEQKVLSSPEVGMFLQYFDLVWLKDSESYSSYGVSRNWTVCRSSVLP